MFARPFASGAAQDAALGEVYAMEAEDRPENPFEELGPVTTDDYGPPTQEFVAGLAQDRERLGIGQVGFRTTEADSYARAMAELSTGAQSSAGDLLSQGRFVQSIVPKNKNACIQPQKENRKDRGNAHQEVVPLSRSRLRFRDQAQLQVSNLRCRDQAQFRARQVRS